MLSEERRVVITGIGTINPLGLCVPEFWEKILQGKSGVRKITQFQVPPHMSQIAGIVDNFQPSKKFADYDRSAQFALHASLEAIQDARLTRDDLRTKKSSVYFATAIAQIASMEKYCCQLMNSPSKHLSKDNNPLLSEFCPFQFNSTAACLSKELGFSFCYATIATGCTGGLDAIGFAMSMIRNGRADIVLTGATEAPITPLVVSAFSKIGATSKKNSDPEKASRPFDMNRDGFVLAEGAGALILESLASAKKRNTKIYAELKGFGSMNNCFHMTDICEDGENIKNACQVAIEDAKISCEDIDFINAHGSSTPQNDVAETNAFHKLFGSRTATIPVTSTKSQIGHALSAANAIEVITSVLSMNSKIISPTINYDTPDPRCFLNVIGNRPRKQIIECILKTSSGFSGIHSSLIICKICV